MSDKKQFISKIEETLRKGCGTVIEEAYISLILETFEGLIGDDVELDENMLIEIANILEAVVDRALTTNDQSKVASMLMARLSCAKYLTIAHVNIIMTTIGLTFKQGNQILYNVSKYNSHINNICLEQMNTLSQLSNTRRQAMFDTAKKQEDVETVATIIKQQFAAL